MAATFFDTHDYVKRLECSGIPTGQAEAHAEALTEAMNNELVRKSTLNEFRAEVKADMAKLRSEAKSNLNEFRVEVKADMDKLRSETRADLNAFRTEVGLKFAEIKGNFDLLKWMVGFTLAGMVSIMFKIFR
ncbi:MAG: hypothetical protein JWP38_140 [Herbaspirillum sp.]|nr:hypothetical protein [Herbaspirillum sp.]